MEKSILDPKEIKNLEQFRDELKLQAHLFKADVKDEWNRVERDMRKLKNQLAPVRRAAKKSAADLGTAARLLFRTVKDGYERIRQSLPN